MCGTPFQSALARQTANPNGMRAATAKAPLSKTRARNSTATAAARYTSTSNQRPSFPRLTMRGTLSTAADPARKSRQIDEQGDLGHTSGAVGGSARGRIGKIIRGPHRFYIPRRSGVGLVRRAAGLGDGAAHVLGLT